MISNVFWIVVAIDAIALAAMFVLDMTARGSNDGGREMSMVFGAVVPSILVGVGAVVYASTTSTPARLVAWILVAAPGAFVVLARGNSALIDSRVRDNATGAGYFTGRDLRAAGAAVVSRDLAALDAAGRRVDVNTKGKGGITLLDLAVGRAFESPAPAESGASWLDVVRKLIAFGANANDGLESATKLPDDGILRVLLDAGANPNFADDRGPVVFTWLNMMPGASFSLLVERGLDVNLRNRSGAPLVIDAAENDRWNLVLLMLGRGADATKDTRTATRLAELIRSRMESTTERPADVKADIARVTAALASAGGR